MPGEIQNVPPEPIAFGKYTLLERISHGGMAEVFRARTQSTAGFEHVVAIKLLLPQVANDSDFVTMLIDEAKIAGQLSHANIAQIFDLGQVEGRYFIVQEYVPGHDLRAILHHLEDSHARLGVAWACHIILKVCEALDYAHNKRDAAGQPLHLVHRDISPQNVIVSHEGEVKLIDFGIVKAEGRATRTLAGLVKGKFAYMSPEQIRGLPVDRRSDVFALGIILHELLTGRPLFKRGSEFETLQRARSGEIEPPSRHNADVPPALDRVALKALSRHVDDRYQSAIAMRDELWEFVRGSDNVRSRDELAAWMRETFGEPSAADLEAATSSAELQPVQPGPRLGSQPLFEDDGDNMTVVDAGLHERLLEAVEEADTVAAVADAAPTPAGAAEEPPESAATPALRDLAAAAQSEPDRAVFLPDDATRAADPDHALDLVPESGDEVHGSAQSATGAGAVHLGDEEETTSARSPRQTQPGPGSPLSWIEPQTPTRRRVTAADEAAGQSDPDPDEEELGPDPEPRAPEVERFAAARGAREVVVSESAPTSPFLQVDPAVVAAAALPLRPPPGPAFGPPPGPDFGPPFGPPPGPIASPDARTIGPAHEVPVPFRPDAAGYPPRFPAVMESPFPPPYQNRMPPPGPGMPPDFRPPDFGGPPHSPMVPPGYGPPPPPLGVGYEPAFPGDQLSDLRPQAGRYLVAAALAILVAAVTVSIVLAVTGA